MVTQISGLPGEGAAPSQQASNGAPSIMKEVDEPPLDNGYTSLHDLPPKERLSELEYATINVRNTDPVDDGKIDLKFEDGASGM